MQVRQYNTNAWPWKRRRSRRQAPSLKRSSDKIKSMCSSLRKRNDCLLQIIIIFTDLLNLACTTTGTLLHIDFKGSGMSQEIYAQPLEDKSHVTSLAQYNKPSGITDR